MPQIDAVSDYTARCGKLYRAVKCRERDGKCISHRIVYSICEYTERYAHTHSHAFMHKGRDTQQSQRNSFIASCTFEMRKYLDEVHDRGIFEIKLTHSQVRLFTCEKIGNIYAYTHTHTCGVNMHVMYAMKLRFHTQKWRWLLCLC